VNTKYVDANQERVKFNGGYYQLSKDPSKITLRKIWWGIIPFRVRCLTFRYDSMLPLDAEEFMNKNCEIKPKTLKGTDVEVIMRIETQSKKYEKYIQNLDKLLGVQTKLMNKVDYGLALYKTLESCNIQLLINDSYDWLIQDKHDKLYLFKVVGVDKKDKENKLVYILGIENSSPYLIKIPSEYIENTIEDLVETEWWKNNNEIILAKE
jgi:hypothetical protein